MCGLPTLSYATSFHPIPSSGKYDKLLKLEMFVDSFRLSQRFVSILRLTPGTSVYHWASVEHE